LNFGHLNLSIVCGLEFVICDLLLCMHDFYLAKEILDTVLKQAKKNNLKTVSKVFLSLGEFAEHNEKILSKNLRQNFHFLASNTLAKKAKLIIKKLEQSNVWRLEKIEGEV